MSSIRRRAAVVLAVLLLAGAGASPGRRRSRRRGAGAGPAATDARAADARAADTRAPDPGAAGTRAPPAQPDARPPPPADGQPIFRAGINFVRVDVIVTDRSGNPVADLTQDDFELAEDGKPQTVETFRLVQIDTTAAGRDRSGG